ncbi:MULTISPECIES: MFS transporter [Rhodococcus]|uniref:MFS transporter n=1 Tax=Rhodococcus oxybenzonivorans TaxID=1990687 RepID=A0AAE4UZM5_9NOCA|nr:MULTISPECIES: MFS transporter [Rhodococcus]MDV7240555.1 MFS transporter [Rhodococcus oxybenzonivorans]MDV7265750.1 MFS transporter [Rhodococcus oxybenzonivorans]MDV7272828.1 MFS transporter [Rhodococcus oxybenzonivorans]MDV7333433.1 MFS transporter [Rhodococcus oxybenzonivorans]MDV7342600.1 MFS transporter [Rhodococcus oxybenzonivorans]
MESTSGAGPVKRADTARRRSPRLAATTGLFGTLVEYYDFSVYAFLAVYFATSFFPSESSTTEVLSALAVFGTAYVFRPLGGIFFGWLGDRRGRRPALLGTIALMGASSFVIGVLPTHDQIGLLAPALLIICRVLQGFSAGGEMMGAVTLAAESSEPKRRGLAVSLTPAGSQLGFATATGVVAVTTYVVGTDGMNDWGWRIPFLLCLPLTICCLLLRLRLEDSPEFSNAQDREREHSNASTTRLPFVEVLRTHRWMLLFASGLTFAATTTGYVANTYVVTFLKTAHDFSAGESYSIVAGTLTVAAVCASPLAGWFTDRYGKTRVLGASTLAVALLSYPLFLIMEATTSLFVIIPAYFVLLSLVSFQTVPMLGLVISLFPTLVRYSAASTAQNLGNIVGGGFAPLISSLLVLRTDQLVSPSWFITVAAVVGLLSLAGVNIFRREARQRVAVGDGVEGGTVTPRAEVANIRD